jgi:hypothetical protein
MTAQMSENVDTLDRVEQIINMLKFLTYEGDCVNEETMQYILKETGIEWSVLRQLILTMPLEQVEYLVEERKDLNK